MNRRGAADVARARASARDGHVFESQENVVHGVEQAMKPDPEGNYVDPATGRRYSPHDLKNSGGVGYTEFNFVHAAPELVVADIRNYQVTDPANRICSLQGATALVGNIGHLNEHYGNLVTYFRIKGIVPPSSRGQ